MLQRAGLSTSLTHQLEERPMFLRQGGRNRNTTVLKVNKQRRVDLTLQRAHLIYLSRHSIHPFTGREVGVRVQQHLDSGQGEHTLLQHLQIKHCL